MACSWTDPVERKLPALANSVCLCPDAQCAQTLLDAATTDPDLVDLDDPLVLEQRFATKPQVLHAARRLAACTAVHQGTKTPKPAPPPEADMP